VEGGVDVISLCIQWRSKTIEISFREEGIYTYYNLRDQFDIEKKKKGRRKGGAGS